MLGYVVFFLIIAAIRIAADGFNLRPANCHYKANGFVPHT
jgi:hypothetical protein